MPKQAEQLDQLPFDIPNPEADDPYYAILQKIWMNEQKRVEPEISAVENVLDRASQGPTVHEWLPEELERQRYLDAVVTRFHLSGQDDFSHTLFDPYREYFGPNVEAFLVVLRKPALHRKTKDPLLVLSDPDDQLDLKVSRRTVIVFVAVLDDIDAFRVSPAVGSQVGVEEISNQLLNQIAPENVRVLAYRAGRRVRRLSELLI